MKIIGLVVEAYGRYVKVRTKEGDIIIKTEKRTPKEGTHIELKDRGVGDYSARVLAKLEPELTELPSLRTLATAERLLRNLDQDFLVENGREVQVRLALWLDEISKRTSLTADLLQQIEDYLNGKSAQELEGTLNLLSGKYGFLARHGVFVFLFRPASRFELFSKGLRIKGLVTDRSVTLQFSRMPSGVDELERELKRSFEIVNFKLAGMEGGFYV